MNKKGIKKMARKPDWKPFKLVPHYSDYGDITHTQIIRRWLQHVNRYFDNLNESIIEFIERYTELSEMIGEHEAFMQAWAEMVEQNENFIEEVKYLLEQSIDDPRVQKWITDRLDKMIKEELPHKLDKNIFYDFKSLVSGCFVSVLEWGAVGDGVSDDTHKIQRAIDETSKKGQTLCFPKGIYKITNSLYIKDNTKMVGVGKNTIIRGVGGSGSMLRTDYDGQKDYGGASNWLIDGFTLDSPDLSMQGIYTDNVDGFEIRNLFSLGNTKHHYLDLNNSRNGLIENIRFIHKHGWAPIQIDARYYIAGSTDKGNTNLTFKNISIIKDKLEKDVSGSSYSGIHFHNSSSRNIVFDGVYMENVSYPVFKDAHISISNCEFRNFYIKETVRPISLSSGSMKKGEFNANLLFKNWHIVGEDVGTAVIAGSNSENVILEDFIVDVGKSEHAFRWFYNDGQGESHSTVPKLKNFVFLRKYKNYRKNFPKVFTQDSDMGKERVQPIVYGFDGISGEFDLKLEGLTGYKVSRNEGFYSINNNTMTVEIRAFFENIPSVNKPIYITGMPHVEPAFAGNRNKRTACNIGFFEKPKEDGMFLRAIYNHDNGRVEFVKNWESERLKANDIVDNKLVVSLAFTTVLNNGNNVKVEGVV